MDADDYVYFPETARKALSVVFTLATLIGTIIHLVRYQKTKKQVADIGKPLHFMKISASTACLVLAVSYGIELMSIFGSSITCSMAFWVFKYEKEMCPFLVGTSLLFQGIFLARNVSRKNDLSTLSGSWWLYFVAAPLLTAIIVLPLILTDSDGATPYCYLNLSWNNAKRTAVEVVCGILPALLAFIVSLAIFSRRPQASDQVGVHGQNLQTVTSLPEAQDETSFTRQVPQTPSAPSPSQGMPYYVGRDSSDYPPQYPAHHYPSYPPQNQGFEQKYSTQYSEPIYAHGNSNHNTDPHARNAQSPIPVVNDVGSEHQDASSPAVSPPIKVGTLFSSHIMVCFVFLLSVVPYSAHSAYIYTREENVATKQEILIIECLNWAKHVYPVLIPLIWLRDL